MATTNRSFFEPKVTNMQYNATQNITGIFQDSEGNPAVCPSGFLCIRKQLLENSGYPGTLNGNAWIMEPASSGAPSAAGTIPHIYAFNSYDVSLATGVNGNKWMVGANTLGLELPANTPGTFTELIENEQYLFGPGDFSTLPADAATARYATIADGKLVASATAPSAGTGFWLEILKVESVTEGTRSAGDGYRCLVRYSGPAGA